MKTIALNAQSRSEMGKCSCRRLRRSGQIPVVLYGQNADPILLAVNNQEFHRAVDKLGDEMVMFQIQAESAGVKSQMAVIREVQRHPVTDGIVHIDLMRIDMKKPIDVEVAVHGAGTPAGIRDGGVLEQILRTVHLRCLPELVPPHISVDISPLLVNQAVHVSDLSLGEGVEILSSVQDVLFHVIPPRKMEEIAPAEGAEAAPTEPELIGKKPEEGTKTSG